jgi:hypothetical protein
MSSLACEEGVECVPCLCRDGRMNHACRASPTPVITMHGLLIARPALVRDTRRPV